MKVGTKEKQKKERNKGGDIVICILEGRSQVLMSRVGNFLAPETIMQVSLAPATLNWATPTRS